MWAADLPVCLVKHVAHEDVRHARKPQKKSELPIISVTFRLLGRLYSDNGLQAMDKN